MIRVGIGQDSHSFTAEKKALYLGGVKLSDEGGLAANSDGDVVLHSLCNALSSAIGGDSISTWSDEMYKRGIVDSKEYVTPVFKRVKDKGFTVGNVSFAVEAKKPFVELEKIYEMKETIAKLLEVSKDQVGITFTSGEGLTAFGQGEAVQSFCQVLLYAKD